MPEMEIDPPFVMFLGLFVLAFMVVTGWTLVRMLESGC
jgi:flagellar biogenesis protein FliO